MKASHKHGLYLLILHLSFMCLIVLHFDNKWYWILGQILLLVSFLLGLRFFNWLEKPFRQLIHKIQNLENQDFSSKLRNTGDPLLDRLIDQYNQLSQKIKEEKILLENQGQFLQALIEASPVGIIVLDYDESISELNPSAEQYLHITTHQARGKKLKEYLDINNEDFHIQGHVFLIHQKKFKIHETKIRHKGFQRKCLLLEDITSEILKSEKEAYGKVIRMMSHEVNNTVGAVNSILESSLQNMASVGMDNDWIEAYQVAIDRNHGLVTFIKNFAQVVKVYTPEKVENDLHEIVKNSAKLWQKIADDKNITLSIPQKADTRVSWMIDRIQIEQVIHNILKNSIESIGKNGEIRIDIDEKKKYICIADNGPGMTLETQKNLGKTPFYSTKVNGQGIGLMLCREILELHGAKMNLKTHHDGWTRFEIYFKN